MQAQISLRMLASGEEVDSERVLATVLYDASGTAGDVDSLGVVPMRPLGNSGSAHAIFVGDGAIHRGAEGPLRYRSTEHFCAGCIALDEGDFGSASPVASVQRVADFSYGLILKATREMGYSHLIRCWNYFSRINESEHGLERYRHFNIGRSRAFDRSGRLRADAAPAASALGTSASATSPGQVVIYFLASKYVPDAIENPRQVSAYHYPSQYGPVSPLFSRATVLSLSPESQAIFVSGTASIVGHQSVHVGDAAAQTVETVQNLEAVVDQANLRAAKRIFSVADLRLRAYLRHPSDLSEVQGALFEKLRPDVDVTWLQADICRADLLVEIEGFGLSDTHRTRPC